MSQEEFIHGIIDSLNSESEDIRKRGEVKTNAFLQDPTTIKLCFEILATNSNERIQKYSVIYARKVLKSFWKHLEEPIRAEIQQMAMQIISNHTFSEEITDNFLDIIKYIYSHDETDWPDLISFMQSINGTFLCLMIANKIIPKMKVDFILESKDFFMPLSLSAMTNPDLKTQVLGVLVFHKYIVKYLEDPGSENHILALIPILSNSYQFDTKNMVGVWGCVNDLLIYDSIPADSFAQIVNIAFSIAQNKELEPKNRYIPLEALNPKIESFSEEMIMNIFSLSIDISASMIENDQSINDATLDYFDSAADIFDHQSLYPLIQKQIQEAFNSNSFTHQISALLIFKILLREFPDLIYNDIQFVINFLVNALSSPNELLKEASLRVIESFISSFKSTNVYTPTFVPLIFANLLSPSPETRVHAFLALYNIFDELDTNMPGFLEQYLSISNQIDPDNLIEYLSLLALIIIKSEDFNDENIDQIIALISHIIESKDLTNIAVCFEIGSALLHQDDTQIDYVIQNLFPFVGQFLQTQSEAEIIDQTFDFIGNLSHHLRENSYNLFQSLIPSIIEYLKNDMIKNEIKAGITINTAKLTKYCGQAAPQIIDPLVNLILNGLKSEEECFQKESARSISKIKKLINPATSRQIFLELIKCLKDTPDYTDKIDDFLLAIAKMIINADQSNQQEFLNLAVEFAQSVFNNTWELLKQKPLIQSPYASHILPPLCNFFSAIVRFPTPINDPICQFLIQWMQKNNEIDLSEIVGTLSDCLQYKNVSAEIQQLILNSVIQIMENATEPTLLQNLIFLMNTLVQDEKASELLPSIIQLIPTFEKWRQIAENSKFGFQDVNANIASLYLQIALRYPDFPDKLIIYSIELFPPFDALETSSMASAIINLLNTKQNPEILEQAALAISRFFVQEESKIEKAKISNELKVMMIGFLKTICSQQEQIFNKIKASYGKQKSKIKKLQNLLNS